MAVHECLNYSLAMGESFVARVVNISERELVVGWDTGYSGSVALRSVKTWIFPEGRLAGAPSILPGTRD